MKHIDMHFHSTRSDGRSTTGEIIEIAKNKGLDFIALTDHDIISKGFQEEVEINDIQSCQSVEISANNIDHNKHLHLTCYAKELKGDIHAILENTITQKQVLLIEQIKKLNSMWFEIHLEKFYAFHEWFGRSKNSLNKYDIAVYIFSDTTNHRVMQQLLWKDNLSITECYLMCFKNGWERYNEFSVTIPEFEPSVEVCWELAHQNNAILSIAHPNFTFKKWIPELEQRIRYYVDRWINAIEINAKATPEWIRSILEIKNRYDLLLTFWSDCHVIWTPDEKHGDFWEITSLQYLDQDFLEKEIETTIRRVV